MSRCSPNNLEFGEVDLFGGTLSSGQNIELTAMGTVSAANLFYVFTGNFTINSGASLVFDPNLRIFLSGGSTATTATPPPAAGTLTDNGTLSFGMGDLFTLNTTTPMSSTVFYPTAQILVGGVMNSTGASFVNQPGSAFTQISVNSGGELIASNSYFAPSLTSLADGTVLNNGDLTNNVFANTVLELPAIDVPLVTNNKQFSEVELLGGTLASGVNLPLTAMGTVLTSTLFYVFAGNYTISSGATITVDPNLSISNQGNTSFSNQGNTLTDNGTLNFGRNDQVSFGTLAVGGVLNAPATSFIGGQIAVGNGGNFTTVGANLNLGNVTLGPGSAASITVSSFATTLTIDSTANINISGNNFTNIGNKGVIATGDANADISPDGKLLGDGRHDHDRSEDHGSPHRSHTPDDRLPALRDRHGGDLREQRHRDV